MFIYGAGYSGIYGAGYSGIFLLRREDSHRPTSSVPSLFKEDQSLLAEEPDFLIAPCRLNQLSSPALSALSLRLPVTLGNLEERRRTDDGRSEAKDGGCQQFM
jgi:hypothetical protein